MSLTDFFGLPNLEIVKMRENDEDIRLDVKNLFEPTFCRQYQSFWVTFHKHGSKEHVFLHMPVRGKRVGLHVDRQRYKCSDCGKAFFEPVENMHDVHRMTKRLVKWIVKEAPAKTFAQLSRETGAVPGTMRNIYNSHVDEELRKRAFTTPRVLGIDEISLNRVHAVFTNIESGLLLDIIPSNKQAPIETFFSTLDRKKVEFVTMDMCNSYRSVVQRLLPYSKVIADRFHVQKCAIRSLEEYRKKLRIGVTPDDRKVLKRERFVLTKRKYDLTEYELEQAQKWFGRFPELEEVYTAKERYMDMWNCTNRKDAEERYDKWKAGLSPKMAKIYKGIITPMGNWREEIFRYFEYGHTNGRTESINGRIRELYNDGRSYSFEVLRGKLLLTVGTLNSSKRKKPYDKKAFDNGGLGRMTGFYREDDGMETIYHGVDINALLNMTNDEFFK